jgi:VWFA-related protein
VASLIDGRAGCSMLLAKLASRALLLLILLSPTFRAQEPPGPMVPRAPKSTAQIPTPPPPPIKANTRLITVYVVATDSRRNVVRGLTANDFTVYDSEGGLQNIANFRFVNARVPQTGSPIANGAPARNLKAEGDQIAPTVLLMDALNTETKQQMAIRRDMLRVLENLPPDTPVAVFLLGHQLQVVQNFTTDHAMLRAALEKVVSPTTNEKYPQYDPDSASNQEAQAPQPVGMSSPNHAPDLEDAEKSSYAAGIQERAEETAKGMSVIPAHLRGFPGRKNLIWFSEAFPIWIEPNQDFGSDPFAGTGTYEPEVQAAAASLMDVGVAVYPADARGLQPDQVYSAEAAPARSQLCNGAAETKPAGVCSPGQTGNAGALQEEDDLRVSSQTTLQRMADDTGGRACENTNNMAGCVMKALIEDASYYEISYYPTNVRWDGRFHRITIQTSQRGIHLDYRRGYIAKTY